MAIQLAFMFLMFTWLRGQPNKTSPAPLTGEVDGVLVTPVATPTPSSAPGLFDTFIAAASGKNLRLPAELAQHEDARLAAIAQLAPNAPLRNAWPQGTRFDVFVFLSECADILDVDFANISPPDVTPLDETEEAAIAAAAPEGSSSQQNGTSGGGLLGLLGIFGESTLKRQLAGPAPKRGDGGHFRALLQAPSDVPRAELVFEQRGLALDWSEANYWEATFNVSLPPRVTANESRIYAHVSPPRRRPVNKAPPSNHTCSLKHCRWHARTALTPLRSRNTLYPVCRSSSRVGQMAAPPLSCASSTP
jgi:hypothetical protein